MRRFATLAVTLVLGTGMAILGGSAAQAAPRQHGVNWLQKPPTKCYTTMWVQPQRPACPGRYRVWLNPRHR